MEHDDQGRRAWQRIRHIGVHARRPGLDPKPITSCRRVGAERAEAGLRNWDRGIGLTRVEGFPSQATVSR